MMKKLLLTQNKYTIIDDRDFKKLSQYKWYAYKHRYTFYAVRNFRIKSGYGGQRRIFMHQSILPPPQNKIIDHINGNGLDNRRNNLRLCSFKENCHNRRVGLANSSGYKGVSFHKLNQKWQAQIETSKNGFRKNNYLGLFDNIKDAAIAYNGAALKYFGNFAYLNKI